MTEICKKHNVDHTGTNCSQCFELYKKHSNELARFKAKYKKALSALKFYGDRKNWHCNNVNTFNDDCIKADTDLYFFYEDEIYAGGKRARQTLAELGEKE